MAQRRRFGADLTNVPSPRTPAARAAVIGDTADDHKVVPVILSVRCHQQRHLHPPPPPPGHSPPLWTPLVLSWHAAWRCACASRSVGGPDSLIGAHVRRAEQPMDSFKQRGEAQAAQFPASRRRRARMHSTTQSPPPRVAEVSAAAGERRPVPARSKRGGRAESR